MLTAEIITIGNELLNGKTIDTNSVMIARMLNETGFQVVRRISVRDIEEDISEMILKNEKSVSLKIFSGGLGPTHDDITKLVACSCFHSQLRLNEDVLQHIQNFFEQRKFPLTQINKDQALVPDKAEVLMNDIGTAPGLVFQAEGTYYFFLPGVPFELEYLMKKRVIPYIQAHINGLRQIYYCDFVFSGIGESFLFDLLKRKTTILNEQNDFAFLPTPGLVKLRQVIREKDVYTAEEIFYKTETQLQAVAGEFYAGRNIDDLALFIQELFIQKGLTISIAESCTGGNISRMITSNSGSSSWFKGSIVAYSNEIKINQLGVAEELITKYGVVSQEVVTSMAQGIRNQFQTDYAIAVSGIAGPDGGTFEKPVGTVCIAVVNKRNTFAKQFNFGVSDRNVIIQRTSVAALFTLYQEFIHTT